MFLVTGHFQAAKRVGGPPAEPEQRAMQPFPKPVGMAWTNIARQLQRLGVFEEYQDRFFSLVRSGKRE